MWGYGWKQTTLLFSFISTKSESGGWSLGCKNKVAAVIYFKKANLLDLNQFKNEKFDIQNSFEDFDIEKYDYISLIIEEGSLKYDDLEKINKYLYLNQEKIVGWFFVNSKTK